MPNNDQLLLNDSGGSSDTIGESSNAVAGSSSPPPPTSGTVMEYQSPSSGLTSTPVPEINEATQRSTLLNRSPLRHDDDEDEQEEVEEADEDGCDEEENIKGYMDTSIVVANVQSTDGREDNDTEDLDSVDTSSNPDGEAKKKQKVGRSPLLAKERKWKDIPMWFSRTDCPLLQLPDHILDRCFALDTGLTLRDYVALAGVSRFFRTQMNNQVFMEICAHFKVGVEPFGRNRLPPESPQVETTLTSAIVSHPVEAWYMTPQTKPIRSIPGNYYIPKGERRNWSREQYKVYQEEREIHLATERLKRYRLGLAASEKRATTLSKRPAAKNRQVKDGNILRTVLATVPGRRNGEPPASKSEITAGAFDKPSDVKRREIAGLRGKVWNKEGEMELEQKVKEAVAAVLDPKIHSASENDSYDSSSSCSSFSSAFNSETDEDPLHDGESDDGIAGSQGLNGTKRKRKNMRRNSKAIKQRKRKQWVVPSTPDDSETDDFEWDEDGNKIIHNYWPSIWRLRAVCALYEPRINKKAAREKYRVTDAELLALKHVLVHNPMSTAAPKQLFLEAAVEALAYRAHGGPVSHAQHVERVATRSKKNIATRLAKVDKAKAEGTYVLKEKKVALPVHWHHPR